MLRPCGSRGKITRPGRSANAVHAAPLRSCSDAHFFLVSFSRSSGRMHGKHLLQAYQRFLVFSSNSDLILGGAATITCPTHSHLPHQLRPVRTVSLVPYISKSRVTAIATSAFAEESSQPVVVPAHLHADLWRQPATGDRFPTHVFHHHRHPPNNVLSFQTHDRT